MASIVQPAGTSKPSNAPPTNQSSTTEYVVRAPNDSSKKFSMIKFSTGTEIDFLKLTNTTVRMERENNLKDYKSAYNIDSMPKTGAGSEYGHEMKEEARRKKFGINIKKYNQEDQPWLMKVGKGKDAKRYKGVREGTITENTSYYIFTQCADGAFEAFPIEEWYNFQPVVQYKYLNSEEAEEEFNRRDKTMNMFSIMVRNRIKNEDTAQEDNEEKKAKKEKKDKSLILTDMEDWAQSSDEEDEEDEEVEDGGDKKPKKEKEKGKPAKRRKNAKMNDNDEAVEESDEGDFDDKELDYISDSGSESSMDEKEKDDKYDDQGVDQEKGLKKLIDSEESSEDEEEEKKDESNEEMDDEDKSKEKKAKKEKKIGDESESSSSSSESDDSDIEKNEEKFSSVLFMQKKKNSSRSNTPTFDKPVDSLKVEQKSEGVKRKFEGDDVVDAQQKKIRTQSPTVSPPTPNMPASSGEITEEAIRRYLMRKPMTAKELVQKFKSKKPQISKDQMTQKIGQLLKKINPERKYVNSILYLVLKKPE